MQFIGVLLLPLEFGSNILIKSFGDFDTFEHIFTQIDRFYVNSIKREVKIKRSKIRQLILATQSIYWMEILL